MTNPIRWGIISTGRIAQTFADDLRRIDEGAAVAVGSRDRERAREFAERYGIPHYYDSYEELVADPDVEAVYVATPHPMHRRDALLALGQKKHVLVEKAFTMNAAEAREVVSAARGADRFLMEAMWTRFLPHVVEIRRLLSDGAIGPLVALHADHGKWFAKDPTHRLFAPELGGGALLDLGVYPVSFASMVLGAPRRVEALVDPAFTGVDGQTSMLFGYESGAHAVLTCTSRARSASRASIIGEDGRIEIEGDFYAPTAFSLVSRSGATSRVEIPVEGRGLQFQAVEVHDCVRSGRHESSIMPLDETVEIMATMDAVLERLTRG